MSDFWSDGEYPVEQAHHLETHHKWSGQRTAQKKREKKMQKMKVKVYCELKDQFTKLVKGFPIEIEKEYVKNDSAPQQEFLDEFKDKTRSNVLELVTLVKGENEGNIKRGFDCIPLSTTDDCDFSAICHFCIGTGVGDERFLLKATIQE